MTTPTLAINIKDSGIRFVLELNKESLLRQQKYSFGFADSHFGEIVYYRTYSRLKEDGTQENWYDTVVRCINGLFTIRKWWFVLHNLPWDEEMMQNKALEMGLLMLQMKWLPPGRGLFSLGTDYLYERGSACLFNCAFNTVEDLPTDVGWIIDFLMCGAGVSFGVTDKTQTLYPLSKEKRTFIVPDSREGWVESIQLILISYLNPEGGIDWQFDYSKIRPYGTPLKGFGGTASGPDPLITLHKRMRKYCNDYISGKDNWTHLVANICNAVGSCVVAGNVRRSAELCVGSPNDETFLDLKDYSKYPERMSIGWMSNNSVGLQGRNDFLKIPGIAKRIRENGEPGILNLVNIQKYARYGDESYGPDAATGVNPCFPGEEYLLTEEGYCTFKDLFDSKEAVSVIVDNRISYNSSSDGKEHPTNWVISPHEKGTSTRQASNVFLTQETAEIVKIETALGFELKCSLDHHVATPRGMVAANDLVPEKDSILIPLPENEGTVRNKTPQTDEEIAALLIGLIQGDGTTSNRVHFDFWGPDKHRMASMVVDLVSVLCKRYPKDSDGPTPMFECSVRDIQESDKVRVSSAWVGKILSQHFGYDFKKGKFSIPKFILASASKYVGKYYLAALFYCDGTVGGTVETSFSVRLNQSNEEFLKKVQLVLHANGMIFAFHKRRDERETLLPDGKGGSKIYRTKTNYELISRQGSFLKFKDKIGFLGHKEKEEKLEVNHNFRDEKTFVSLVKKVTKQNSQPVYCIQEPITRSIIVSGCSVRRCGEIPLEATVGGGELCCLAEVLPSRCSSRKEFLKAVECATFYASTVILYPTHSGITNSILARNRRIGVSLTGIAEWIDTWGHPRCTRWMMDGYNHCRSINAQVNKEAGVPPSIRCTTVKPSGTVSQLAGVPSGMHHPLFNYAIRRIIIDRNSPISKALIAANYPWEPCLEMLTKEEAGDREYFKEYEQFKPSKDIFPYKSTVSVVFEVPIEQGKARPISEVSAWEQFSMLAMLQRSWSDNSVSCTVSYNPETEGHQIEQMLTNFIPVIKSVSMLPHAIGTYPQMPYEGITKEEYEQRIEDLSDIDWNSVTGVVNTGAATLYCESDRCEVQY
jgi:hypothetical protein